MEDHTTKKEIYQNTFHTYEYFCYDPDKKELHGWKLRKGKYRPIKPNEIGWLWCAQVGLWLGTWNGVYHGRRQIWLRFFDAQGKLVPTFSEAAQTRAQAAQLRAEAAKHQAEAEKQRADALQAELARLKAQLKKKS